MSRYKARIYCMTIMYQVELGILKNKIPLSFFNEKLKKDKDKKFIIDLFYDTIDKRDYLIEIIEKMLNNWSFQRLGILEKSILLLGANEMLSFDTIPLNVSINEWVEITKSYCGEISKKFINGVLNGIKEYFLENKIIIK